MSAAIAYAAFAAGLLGGVHCAGMCGGIVATLSTATRGPVLARQLAYNGGRIASYATAGALAGGLGSLVQASGALLTVQLALFVLANAIMILLGFYVAGFGSAVLRFERIGGLLWRRVEPFARRVFPIDSTPRALAAGLVWGWVPCGLVYSMLVLALASGSAATGAWVMAAFGLGTLPTLLAAGLAAQHLAALRRSDWIRRGAGAAIAAFGVAGLLRAPHLREAVLAGWACIT